MRRSTRIDVRIARLLTSSWGLQDHCARTASSWTSERFYKCLWKRSICDSAHKELRTFNAENVPQGAVSQPLWGEGSQNGYAYEQNRNPYRPRAEDGEAG